LENCWRKEERRAITRGLATREPKAKLSQKTEGSTTSSTGLRTRTETVDNMEDEEVIFEMEKGPKQQIKADGTDGDTDNGC
jgi:hypothetical protein